MPTLRTRLIYPDTADLHIVLPTLSGANSPEELRGCKDQIPVATDAVLHVSFQHLVKLIVHGVRLLRVASSTQRLAEAIEP